MTATINKKNKPLKWTTQRVPMNNNKSTTTTANRVHKRTRSSASTTSSSSSTTSTNILTASTKNGNCLQEEINRLEKEISFTLDAVATITVHYDSLHLTYTSSKPQLDQFKNATRLGEMEKELLAAYDDLELQMNHLGRKMAKLEKRLCELREQIPQAIKIEETEASIQSTMISSPCSSTDSILSDPAFFLPEEPMVAYDFAAPYNYDFTATADMMMEPFECYQPPCEYNDIIDYSNNNYYYYPSFTM